MSHQAPLNSPDHNKLCSTLKSRGISKETVQHFLWGINAPDRLVSFAQIAKNIGLILRLAEGEMKLDVEASQMKDWLSISDAVAVNHKKLIKEIGADFNKQPKLNKEGEGVNPLKYYAYSRHPIYSALWTRHEDVNLGDKYRLLQAHILIAHLALIESSVELNKYLNYGKNDSILGSLNSSVYNACTLLKDFSKSERSNELKALPLEMKHKDFYGHILELRASKEDSANSEFPSAIKHFGLLFKRAYCKEEAGGGGSGNDQNPRGSSKRKFHDGHVDIWPESAKQKTCFVEDDDPDANWGEQHLIHGKSDTEDWNDAGLCPFENETGEELVLADCKDSEEPRSILSQYIAAHGQIRHVTMANQMLRNRWAQLTVYEVGMLMLFCGKEFRAISKENIAEGDLRTLEEIALIMIMLWTGSDLERARQLSYIEADEDSDFSEIAYIAERDEWRIKPFSPSYKTEPTDGQISLSRDRSEYIYLPDPFNIGGYILPIARIPGRKQKGLFLNRQIGTQKKQIKKFLEKMGDGKTPDENRVSESKISRYLFFLIASETSGDVADAILITGQYHPLGRTLLHYTTPSADYLRDIYIKAVKSVVENICLEKDGSGPPPFKEPGSLPGKYLGSRLCPKEDDVRTMVDTLKTEIQNGLESRKPSDYLRYHNIYTTYTSLMLGYATGFRAIRLPYVQPRDIDPETGLTIISDKDGNDFYNSRPIWIPDSVKDQLTFYEEHRKLVASEVGLRTSDFDSKKSTSIFLLTKKFELEDPRPKRIASFLETFSQMPINVNRRFLRTELKADNCPIEVVNCFMGHWSRGEEPWGKYSSFSFHEYVAAISECIPAILEKLAWEPVRSQIFK